MLTKSKIIVAIVWLPLLIIFCMAAMHNNGVPDSLTPEQQKHVLSVLSSTPDVHRQYIEGLNQFVDCVDVNQSEIDHVVKSFEEFSAWNRVSSQPMFLVNFEGREFATVQHLTWIKKTAEPHEQLAEKILSLVEDDEGMRDELQPIVVAFRRARDAYSFPCSPVDCGWCRLRKLFFLD